MMQTWILIQTTQGKADRVAAAVAAIEGVERAETTTGPYDVVARAHAPTADGLGVQLLQRVQAVPGTTRTLTCPVA